MHTQAILNAHAAEKVLFYVPAVDKPASRLSRSEFDELRGEPNIATSAKLPGILPLFVGMEVILSESFLPPKYVRGTVARVEGIELHPREPEIKGRDSITSQGCVVLRYMPKCVYVWVPKSSQLFLQKNDGASQPADLQGVLAVRPVSRSWSCKVSTREKNSSCDADAGASLAAKTDDPAWSARENCGSWFHRALDVTAQTIRRADLACDLRVFESAAEFQQDAQPWPP